MPPAMHPDDPGAEQPFVSHLIELRDRMIRGIIAIFVLFLALFTFANEIYVYVAAPLMAQLPEGNTMIATQVAAPFLTPFKLALIAAVFLAMPVLIYQMWAFIAPGLYRHEKRLAMPLLISSIILFYVGMLFAYYVVFPLVFAFLSASTPDGVAMMTDITAYLVVATGITTPADLVRVRPYVIVAAFVIGMLLTPPDVISQTLLAVPMWLLFELGVIFSKILIRRDETEDESSGETGSASAAQSAPAPKNPSGGSGGQTGASPAPTRPTGPTIEVGRDLDPHFDEADRWRPLSESEMEAELDLIEAEEVLGEIRREAPEPSAAPDAKPAPTAPGINSVEEKIKRANRLRELGSTFAARTVLYEVLEEGDADQRNVARNILRQLDHP